MNVLSEVGFDGSVGIDRAFFLRVRYTRHAAGEGGAGERVPERGGVIQIGPYSDTCYRQARGQPNEARK